MIGIKPKLSIDNQQFVTISEQGEQHLLSEEESEESFQRLKNVLDESVLNWIIPQVVEAISQGKLVDAELVVGEMARDSDTGEYKISRGRKRVAAKTTVPYSPKEKLGILINAVEMSVNELSEMERLTLQFISFKNVSKIAFYDEEQLEPTFSSNADEVGSRQDWTSRVARNVSNLKDHI